MRWEDFQLVTFSGNKVESQFQPYFSEGFKHWMSVWNQRFTEAGSRPLLVADNFTRQDDIFAIFHNEKCVAMICSRFCDLSYPNIKADSYFLPWPEIAYQKLREDGDFAAIGSQISVDQSYRGLIEGFSLKNIVTILSMNYLFQTGVRAITGTMRADKNMHSMCYKLGAQKLAENIIMHGGPVELIGFFPKRFPLQLEPAEKALINQLWSNKIGSTSVEITTSAPKKKSA